MCVRARPCVARLSVSVAEGLQGKRMLEGGSETGRNRGKQARKEGEKEVLVQEQEKVCG